MTENKLYQLFKHLALATAATRSRYPDDITPIAMGIVNKNVKDAKVLIDEIIEELPE